jgi:hypothetical protein
VRSLLIGLRKIRNAYISENSIKIISSILKEMEIISNFSYFISNNLTTNNVAIRYILKKLRSNIK